jgi:hypothetical protein
LYCIALHHWILIIVIAAKTTMRDDSDREDGKSAARNRSRSPPAGARRDMDKKASRLSKLQAWKQSQQASTSTSLETAVKKAQEAAAAVQAAKVGTSKQIAERDVDPLDAFMESEIMPEVRQKEEEERRQAEEDRKNLQELLSKGGKLPKSIQELIEDDEEPKPDMELQIPENKLKLVIGPGGERIKMIERQSKCRIQHAKASADLNRGFGVKVPLFSSNTGAITGEKPTERKLITLQLFGNVDACETARSMILEAMENKEQKAKQRAKEYEKKKESKRTERHIYHLRHARDYEALELPLGASKSDVKAAFRRLALKWHPDKNIGRQRLCFQFFNIYNSIMMTIK